MHSTALRMFSTMAHPVKFQLQLHLINMHHQKNTGVLNVGTMEQLETATKIYSSEAVSKCFDYWDGTPKAYPILPEGGSLVACIDRWVDRQVVVVYTLEQMEQIQELRGTSKVHFIEWKVLEIPRKLEFNLLQEVSLEDGLIISSHPKPSDKT